MKEAVWKSRTGALLQKVLRVVTALGVVIFGQNIVRAQNTTGLDGGKPAAEVVGDVGAPYGNLFRPASVGGGAANGKVGPGRLNIPIPQIGAPSYTIPLIERGFQPEEAEIKIGPLYIDFREVSGSLLVSDNINASNTGRKKGAISVVRMQIAALLQLNEGLRLATEGSIIALPFKGKIGVNGFGIADPFDVSFGASPIARMQLTYDATLGGWDIRLIDEFDITTTAFSSNLTLDQQFEGLSSQENAEDTAGRYSYQIRGSNARRGVTSARDQGFEDRDLIYHNMAGVTGTRLLPIDVAANLGYFHHNYWYSKKGTGIVRDMDETRSSLISERENTRFKPFIRHQATTDNTRKGWDHEVTGGVFGPVTDYIDFLGEYGRHFEDHSSSSDSLWRLRLDHDPGPLTTHYVEYGRTITRPERTLATYARYGIYRVIGPHMLGELFAEHLRSKSLTVGQSGYTQRQIGARASYNLGERMDLRLTTLYQRLRLDNPAAEKIDNFVTRLEFIRRHTETMDSTIMYEFTDRESSVTPNSYYENLLLYTLRKSF